MGYSMIEMIDNRLDQLFSQRDLYTFSPFSVEDLRDNIIMFIIKDAYAESERKKSLRANRGTDSDADRMRDSRNIAYAQHYRNLQYERIKEEIGEQISELLPDDYYQAWEPPFLSLRAIGIYCIIKLESHHYI